MLITTRFDNWLMLHALYFIYKSLQNILSFLEDIMTLMFIYKQYQSSLGDSPTNFMGMQVYDYN